MWDCEVRSKDESAVILAAGAILYLGELHRRGNATATAPPLSATEPRALAFDGKGWNLADGLR